MMNWGSASVLMLALTVGFTASARGDESVSPYIDSLKQQMKSSPGAEGYSESIRKKLPETEAPEGYTERLKKAQPLNLQGAPSERYSEKIRQTLEPKAEGGAIEAVREGHSELSLKKPGKTEGAFGFRVGLGPSHTLNSGDIGTGRDFNNIYGQHYAPDLSLFYEYQFFHSEIYGSLGAFGMAEVAYFHGSGAFAVQINSAETGQAISPDATGVSFQFYEVPGTAGLSYRLNLAKYIRPFLMGGPTIIGMSESRTDGKPTHHALSHGLWGSAGVSFLMDWVSKMEDWDRFQDYSIKHTYLTFEYNHISTFSSPVDVSSSGAYAGFTFEY